MSDPSSRDDLDAWRPQEPSAGFADRVLVRVSAEPPRRTSSVRARTVAVVAALAVAVASAAGFAIAPRFRSSQGEIAAEARTQAPLGARIVGVLEPGARVSWRGDELVQESGDVFYRVEPGAPVVVHTPLGDVTVLGTCFRVRIEMNRGDLRAGAVGAALSAVAFVAVYEGKVRVSRADQAVTLAPGEAARAGKDRIEKLAGGAAAMDRARAAEEAALARAGQNAAESVREYQKRLDAVKEEKARLEAELADAQSKLDAKHGGAPKKSDYDLAPEDWAKLSQEHAVKFRLPCTLTSDMGEWPSATQLESAGLPPGDAAVVRDAWTSSNARVWAGIKPLCAQAVGSADVAESIGPNTCLHLIVDMADRADHDATRAAFGQVGAIRSGQATMPPNPSATLQALMLMTSEPALVESELAKGLGPDDAHRLLYQDKGLCMQSSSWSR
jgi:hypothetical protein